MLTHTHTHTQSCWITWYHTHTHTLSEKIITLTLNICCFVNSLFTFVLDTLGLTCNLLQVLDAFKNWPHPSHSLSHTLWTENIIHTRICCQSLWSPTQLLDHHSLSHTHTYFQTHTHTHTQRLDHLRISRLQSGPLSASVMSVRPKSSKSWWLRSSSLSAPLLSAAARVLMCLYLGLTSDSLERTHTAEHQGKWTLVGLYL